MAWNWLSGLGQGVAGSAGGALTGASIGSAVPVIGTSLGAGVGALLGLLSGGISGGMQSSSSGFEQSPSKFTPEQEMALSEILKQGLSNLKTPTAGFEPIETYHRQKFQGQVIPGLAERFAGLGQTRRSGGELPLLTNVASDFEQGMAALKAQYGQQAQANALAQLQLGLTPRFEQLYFGAPPQIGSSLLETGLSNLPNLLSSTTSSQSSNDIMSIFNKAKSGKALTDRERGQVVEFIRAFQKKGA